MGREYDLVIVGGGIFGACAAWDASQRGLSVALVERGDFCNATSANHFKLVHGGIRYLQHGDLYRIRESSRDRNALLRIAPHLVQPLPIVVPTYGHGLQGKGFLASGFLLYDLLVFDRNRGLRDPQQRIPPGHFISKEECLRLFPGLDQKRLTGAAVFWDGQMYNPPRLVLSFLKSAVHAGAQVANYVEARGFLHSENRVLGIMAKDTLTGEEFQVRAKVVLNAAGPWAEGLLNTHLSLRLPYGLTYSRDACFVVAGRLTGDYALAVQARTSDPDAIMSRGHRHIFIAPWRNYTLIGVWHMVYRGDPDTFTVTEEDLLGFLGEVNSAYRCLNLSLQDVTGWNAGLVLFGENKPGATDLSFGKRSQLIDHTTSSKVDGLITLIGVRATTSRGVAERAVDLVFKKLGREGPKSMTAVTPIYGGRIECFEDFIKKIIKESPPGLSPEMMRALGHNYGSEYQEVLKSTGENPAWVGTVDGSQVLKAEIVHAVRDEMACKLSDVVFRRTDLATGEYPGEAAIRMCAELMAPELGWNTERVQRELGEVRASFPSHVFAAKA